MQLYTQYAQAQEHLQRHPETLEQALHVALLASPLHYREIEQASQSQILKQTINAIYQVLLDSESLFPLDQLNNPALLAESDIYLYHTYLQVVRTATNQVLRQFLLEDPEAISHAIERITEAIIQTKQQQQQLRFSQDIATHQRDARAFVSLADNAVDGIVITDLQAIIIYANSAFHRMLGADQSLVGKNMAVILGTGVNPEEIVRQVLEEGSWNGVSDLQSWDGTTRITQLSVFSLPDEHGNPIAIPGIIRDITDQVQREQEREELQRQIIDTQQALLHELSTPLIPISNDTLVMPIIGSIDTVRAHQILEHALQGLNESKAANLIIDITGVPIVDTHVANVLIQTSTAARLLGARCMLTGIRPEVAQTLVSLNIDLQMIETHANLQVAIARTLARQNRNN